MTPRIAVFIIHAWFDLRRRRWVQQMQEQLTGFHVEVFEDRTKAGHWVTHRRAYARAAELTDFSHVLFLPDDFKLAKDFERAITDAVIAVPDKPVQFFNLTKTWALDLEQQGYHWYVQKNGITGNSTVWPIETIRPFLPWVDQHVKPVLRGEDSYLVLYLEHGWKHPDVWVTVPSLAQHIGAEHSIMNANNPEKIAVTFLGDRPASEIDWTPPTKVPRHSAMQVFDKTKAAYIP